MKGTWHFIIGMITFILSWMFIKEIHITMIFIPIALSLFPDADFKIRSHRNFLFHSIIPWSLVWLYNPTIITALSCLSIGIHLFLDITYTPKKWKWGYLLKFYKKGFFWFAKGKQGALTTIWLFVNFSLSVLIFMKEVFY